MHNVKKKGFTLIELIAVLVIMAIIALIATPLVMNIIRSARISADKRSIDAYGRSVELAIAGYLMDTGKFATDINQLTIEYSGDEVVCSTTQLNTDSSVYLAGCTVGGRSVDNYTYGSDKTPTYQSYSVGDALLYNGVNYHVIEDSSENNKSVKLIKDEPLSYQELQIYSAGTDAQIYNNNNGYGGMNYGQNNVYSQSYVKSVVEAWANDKILSNDLKEVRLITKNEYSVLSIYETYETPSEPGHVYVPMYDWLYGNYYCYTMTPFEDDSNRIINITERGSLLDNGIDGYMGNGFSVVRPVVELYKSALN